MKPITEPYYTIGTGNGNVMYCLRFVENDYRYSQGQIVECLGVKSSYICNLSIDFELAIKKAKARVNNYQYKFIVPSEKETAEWGSANNNWFDLEKAEADRLLDNIKKQILAMQVEVFEEIKEFFYQNVPSNYLENSNKKLPNTKKIYFSGKVLGTKVVEGDYGTYLKCLFKDNRGFTLYGNYGSRLQDRTDGEGNLEFFAYCKPSDDDKYFGFFNNATKSK
jgi:hypothetical protein